MAKASTPPITKKTSADAPYMIPIFLWSTVLIHARQPLFVRGRVNTPRAECSRTTPPEGRASTSEGRSTIAMASLLQRLEVGDERIDLLVCEVQVRHATAALCVHRLLARRVLQPGL